jgi:hypothetical protein
MSAMNSRFVIGIALGSLGLSALVLSNAGRAQSPGAAPAAAANADVVGELGPSEGIFVDGKTFKIAKGKAKGDPSAQMAKLGAKEVGPGAIVFRYNDKLYIAEGAPQMTPQAMKSFQDQWANGYMKAQKEFQDQWANGYMKSFQDQWAVGYMKNPEDTDKYQQAMKNFQEEWNVSYVKAVKEFQDNWANGYMKNYDDQWNVNYMKSVKEFQDNWATGYMK